MAKRKDSIIYGVYTRQDNRKKWRLFALVPDPQHAQTVKGLLLTDAAPDKDAEPGTLTVAAEWQQVGIRQFESAALASSIPRALSASEALL